MRCTSSWISGVFCAVYLATCSCVWSAGTLDRDYGLGDDGGENASSGAVVGASSSGVTFDSFGAPGNNELHDLTVFGNPTYASVSDRPQFSSGLGASFDGNGDYLRGSNLNLPDTSIASVNHDDDPSGTSLPGPLNYAGISDRYFQLWVKPDAASSANTQSVVMDTNEHGLRIVDGKWSLRYGGTDYDSTANVDFGQWSHVMVARPSGAAGGSQLYVNGNAVVAAGGGYNGGVTEELVVGSNTGRDANLAFIGGTGEFYHGLLDDLTLAVLGDNTGEGGQDYGSFDFGVDNQFAAGMLSGIAAADVNLDGSVSGDGTGPAASDDVTAFVNGWLSSNEINGVRVADLGTRQQGDLDFNGITNLRDFAILNAANPALAANVATLVPEPSTQIYLFSLLLLPALLRRKK